VLNAAIPVCYVLLRVKYLRPGVLSGHDRFGVTREAQIMLSFALMLIARTLSFPTLDVYLASAFFFTRLTVLLLLWFMDSRICMLFFVLWLAVYMFYPQPRFKHSSSVIVLNNVTFDERVICSTAQEVNVVWFHATWSARCAQLASVLTALSAKYPHARIRFCKVDLSRWPQLAERYNIALTASSQQLPTVMCFRQGIETARVPDLADVHGANSKWRCGFTAVHIAEDLHLDQWLSEAVNWDEEARQCLLEASNMVTANDR
jgi:thiol-disulfide isomerase/thioredoxin